MSPALLAFALALLASAFKAGEAAPAPAPSNLVVLEPGYPFGFNVNVSGVEEFNLTLTGMEEIPSLSSVPLCNWMAGVPSPNTYFTGYSTMPEVDQNVGVAKMAVYAEVGSTALLTFTGKGFNSTTLGPLQRPTYAPPFIVTVLNTTDTGAATGPLYVTKSAVDVNKETGATQYQLDLAEFTATAAGQSGWVAGGMTSLGYSEGCLFNVTFFAV